jgi:hypothetical protein
MRGLEGGAPAISELKDYAGVREMTNALIEVSGRLTEPTQLWRMVA